MQEEHQQYLRTSELRRKAIVVILRPCHWDSVPSGDGLGRHYERNKLVVVVVWLRSLTDGHTSTAFT